MGLRTFAFEWVCVCGLAPKSDWLDTFSGRLCTVCMQLLATLLGRPLFNEPIAVISIKGNIVTDHLCRRSERVLFVILQWWMGLLSFNNPPMPYWVAQVNFLVPLARLRMLQAHMRMYPSMERLSSQCPFVSSRWLLSPVETKREQIEVGF